MELSLAQQFQWLAGKGESIDPVAAKLVACAIDGQYSFWLFEDGSLALGLDNPSSRVIVYHPVDSVIPMSEVEPS